MDWFNQWFSPTVHLDPDMWELLIVVATITFFITWSIMNAFPKHNAVWRERRQSAINGVIAMANRRAFLDSKYADMFNDGLLKMWAAGEISWQEYLHDARRFGLRLGLRDLLPISAHPRAIRKRVKYNCDTMHREMKDVQPRIPGPKPGETVPLSPVVRVYRVTGKRLS